MTEIQITRIIDTNILVYSAWEATTICGDYVTIRHGENGWLGRIGTQRCPKAPVGAAEAVRTFYRGQYQRAYDAIRQAHPDLVGREIDGEITVVVDS